MTQLKPFDTIALLRDINEHDLIKGQVGTILEVIDNNVFEVEFTDKQGKTLSTLGLTAKDLMLLYFEEVKNR